MNKTSYKKRINNLISKICTRKLEDNLYYISVFVILAVSLFYFMFNAFVEFTGFYMLRECGMKKLFGIPCPGCGGTRALISLFTGNLLNAVYYNAFVVYCVIVYAVFFISHTISKISMGRIREISFQGWYVPVALIILIIQYVLKLILPCYKV